MTRKFKRIIIDADSMCYKAAASIEQTIYTILDPEGNEDSQHNSAKDRDSRLNDLSELLMIDTSDYSVTTHKEYGELEDIYHYIDNRIEEHKYHLAESDQTTLTCYLSGSNNFRDDIATRKQYKGNRDPKNKPKYLKEAREYLVRTYAAKIIDYIEADDCVSVILNNQYRKLGSNLKDDSTVVLSRIDKDLDCNPGWLWNPDKQELIFQDMDSANHWLFTQALTGDRVDNIEGCPALGDEFRKEHKLRKAKGVGIATATKLLEGLVTPQDLYNRCLEAYTSALGEVCEYETWQGDTVSKTAEEILDENLSLLWMMRTKDKFWMDEKEEFLGGLS